MNDEGFELMLRTILKLEERVYALEHPAKLEDLPKIEPERLLPPGDYGYPEKLP